MKARQSGKRAVIVPRRARRIERAAKVTVHALDERGEKVELTADGLLGVAVQHENDHLDGVLMIDHMGVLKRKMALPSCRGSPRRRAIRAGAFRRASIAR